MTLSAAHCRAQAAHQANRARDEPLEMVRAIALASAQAWTNEALLAEKREARQVKVAAL